MNGPFRAVAPLWAAVLLGTSAGGAQATEPVQGLSDFISICVDTEARPEAVLAASEALGYRRLEGELEGFTFSLVLNSADANRLIFFEQDETVLEVQDGAEDQVRLSTAECIFGDQTTSQAELTRLATEWMGRQASIRNRHGNLEWRFELNDDRTPLPADERMDLSPLERNPIALLSVFETEKGSVPLISLAVFARP